MRVGRKAQGHRGCDKLCVQRHGHSNKRSYNAAEKAIETRVRHQGKQECQER